MSTINRARARWHLSKLGWRTGTSQRLDAAIRDFQTGYNLRGAPLTVDGVVGAKTMAAILNSSQRLTRKQPTASEHFSFIEFACKCGGRYAGCRRIVIDRDLIRGLEKLRAAHYKAGLTLISGYRCPDHNAAVGGASASQHMHGRAADIPSTVPSARVRDLGAFGGLGITARTGTVAHVDVRPVSHAAPTTWLYN